VYNDVVLVSEIRFVMFLVDPTAVSCVRSAENLDTTADQADTSRYTVNINI
jgi:hypothetical protein